MEIGVPLATIEFAILDMMGRMAGRPAAELIDDGLNPDVGLYNATELRAPTGPGLGVEIDPDFVAKHKAV